VDCGLEGAGGVRSGEVYTMPMSFMPNAWSDFSMSRSISNIFLPNAKNSSSHFA
jgi:hypothetical protein